MSQKYQKKVTFDTKLASSEASSSSPDGYDPSLEFPELGASPNFSLWDESDDPQNFASPAAELPPTEYSEFFPVEVQFTKPNKSEGLSVSLSPDEPGHPRIHPPSEETVALMTGNKSTRSYLNEEDNPDPLSFAGVGSTDSDPESQSSSLDEAFAEVDAMFEGRVYSGDSEIPASPVYSDGPRPTEPLPVGDRIDQVEAQMQDHPQFQASPSPRIPESREKPALVILPDNLPTVEDLMQRALDLPPTPKLFADGKLIPLIDFLATVFSKGSTLPPNDCIEILKRHMMDDMYEVQYPEDLGSATRHQVTLEIMRKKLKEWLESIDYKRLRVEYVGSWPDPKIVKIPSRYILTIPKTHKRPEWRFSISTPFAAMPMMRPPISKTGNVEAQLKMSAFIPDFIYKTMLGCQSWYDVYSLCWLMDFSGIHNSVINHAVSLLILEDPKIIGPAFHAAYEKTISILAKRMTKHFANDAAVQGILFGHGMELDSEESMTDVSGDIGAEVKEIFEPDRVNHQRLAKIVFDLQARIDKLESQVLYLQNSKKSGEIYGLTFV